MTEESFKSSHPFKVFIFPVPQQSSTIFLVLRFEVCQWIIRDSPKIEFLISFLERSTQILRSKGLFLFSLYILFLFFFWVRTSSLSEPGIWRFNKGHCRFAKSCFHFFWGKLSWKRYIFRFCKNNVPHLLVFKPW